MSKHLAHRDARSGNEETLGEHLKLVAERAKEYASAFGASEEAYLAGLLHDLGKYGELFQQRLKGKAKGVDHWSAGAWMALQNYRRMGIATALAVQGHHIGLQAGNKDSLDKLNPHRLLTDHPLKLKLSEADINQLTDDGLTWPAQEKLISSLYEWEARNASSMLDARMLFSALVDADFIETEAWFQMGETGERRYRELGLPLEPAKALNQLHSHLKKLAQDSDSSVAVHYMRQSLLEACMETAEMPCGLFTLTAPTGSGKTLAMLAFALSHAAKHNLRRVVVVIPYLTIIEQTAQVYRKIFQSPFSPSELDRYILEHHSLSGIRAKDDKARIEDEDYRQRLLTENWDAPIIITTNVQFLESLFSNRPSACRKLHRLAGSVILFDEVQTMPVSLAIPTLATLSRLTEHYRSTIVFATATQPAFSHLHEFVRQHCASGWQPREIVPTTTNLFARSRRNQVTWPEADKTISWTELADRLVRNKQVLCVVNLKRQAKALYDSLEQSGAESAFHLSTNMCPAHRQAVLEKVRLLLAEGKACHLISTQCVEAGVDIDFPVVYRALGPLDAIAQAAGRCNRNGHLMSGEVYVFKPEPEDKGRLYPDGAYEQAASVASILLNELGPRGLDINDPETFQRYYRQLYLIRGIGAEDKNKEPLLNAIARQDFLEVAQNYRLIVQDTINVLVPYDQEIFAPLRDEALNNGLSRQWIRKVRPYTVSLFRPRSLTDSLYLSLEPILLKSGEAEKSDEWYICRKEEDYDPNTGLNPSLSPNLIIA
ncbi:CRISPR-associated endonuclease/helicase Cas3 [Candidatus Hakubella thermalkaliphila]|uniref:CRISPR-associated endonuclease/helicase Cas3 n=2 Tax=Candidatus Hakubella thermalkaliphila TaxID=2754717 RepID=A0A6V8NPJ8_9ACTN|nr:CRISPR-associated helicase Cas3' [Candidatus Hakubella thermalkaliphila]MBT9167734.1 Reverse gyrase [Bacillota bacterium]GFP21260.1 CRISPR-associated endonuclease/helicase Cas3 [Candidatus Hakubella thermalkaliphila]GFP41594.1 CRISPR-associated endonuclease/helicase Cas3 [Candidatus Hakubella thermalkaliphila]